MNLTEIGLSLSRAAADQKREFLAAASVLTKTEAAAVLGCRPRDLGKFIEPDYVLNGRPKYRISTVKEAQARLIRETRHVRTSQQKPNRR